MKPELVNAILNGSAFGVRGVNLKKIERQHAIERIEIFNGVLSVRLWLQGGVEIKTILLRANNEVVERPFISSVTYQREDATKSIGANAVGATLFLAAEALIGARTVSIALILSNGETILHSAEPIVAVYESFSSGIIFDILRRGAPIEPYLLKSADPSLLPLLSGCWRLHLAKIKSEYKVIRSKVQKKPAYSLITVFY
ncbi:MAG: hypothetical protein V4603_05755, partial [Pseudomonadota bacterium]